ncbi:amidohydrolase family protein [Nocardioides humi]|uniref:amidohydrolase family protein n=1 Tax=Nocardioides humi TaxID=449461 RepID=UPI00112E793E|nr:amidohydrolase family protein [Nocardioides humi]
MDVHGHAVPESVLALMESSGDEYGGITVDRSGDRAVITLPGGKQLRPLPVGMSDGPSRDRWMTRQGVGTQLVGPWMDIQGNGFEREAGIAWSRALNDAMAEGLPTIGDRVRLLATVYPADPQAAVAEMLRTRADLGAVGVMMATHFPQGSAADEEMLPFWTAAAENRIPVVLHPPIVGPASAIEGDKDFRSLYGRTLETSLVATRMIVTGLFEKLPDLQIVLVHGGGFLPFQAGRLDQQVADDKIDVALPAGRAPSSYLKHFLYDTAMLDPEVVAFLASRVPDRVLVGTDYPFTARTSLVPEQLAALSAEDQVRMSAGTAGAVFDLRQPEAVR